MSFDISTWDGLAKLGIYSVNGRSFTTPALFPVVHPTRQEIEASRIGTEFGFQQFITSTYLLSKKYSLDDLPAIHELLNFDGVIMMDSGAYQLMVYGDVELDKRKTMEIQKKVGTDIGVIMDHPIGYDVPFEEAERRVQTTIERVHESIEFMGEEVNWTLPIQGGKYVELIDRYLDAVLTEEVLSRYKFFAIGSVVQVMIRQDYLSMVKMIIDTRKRLPVKYPLHLFGAGHPSMFALATYLGCDTFDSAAYSLMARDGRYMTTHGTYKIDTIQTLPCTCPVCSSTDAKSLRNMEKDIRRRKLAEHNLWVSAQEIKLIRLAISRGELRNLVIDRMTAVPGLGIATKYALEQIEKTDLFKSSIPVSRPVAMRISSIYDVNRPEIVIIRQYIERHLRQLSPNSNEVILLFLNWKISIYKKVPDEHLRFMGEEIHRTFIASPFFGLIPFGLGETYPLSQFWSDLLENELPTTLNEHLTLLLDLGITKVRAYIQQGWSDNQLEYLRDNFDLTEIYSDKIVTKLRDHFGFQDL